MRSPKSKGAATLILLLVGLGLVSLVAAACGGEEEEAPPAPEPTVAVEQPTAVVEEPTRAPEPTAAREEEHEAGKISFEAASATITVDGDISDWEGIEGVSVTLEQFEMPPGVDWDEPGPLDPIDVVVKVATDADNIYVLFLVPDDYDFDPEDHNRSASPNVMFRIEQAAGPHMGAGDEDFEVGLGMVDIWHWELDCGPGEISGGQGIAGGDDPDCNLDDEYSTGPEERWDDGKGDVENPNAENSLVGVWEHTARAEGTGADGIWIFEMSRPLQTGDPQDAQFQSGGTAFMALAYFDADETSEGWTDTGHLTSAEAGWIEVILP